MLNSKELKERIVQLLAEDKLTPYVIGNGIISNMKIGFNEEKLKNEKQKIAEILKSLGVNEHPLIKLSDLTKLKNGDTWNNLQTIEDFQALELLLACSHACGFINNDDTIIRKNIMNLGDIGSISISPFRKAFIKNDDEWLRLIREDVIDGMFFFTNPEYINHVINDIKRPPILHK